MCTRTCDLHKEPVYSMLSSCIRDHYVVSTKKELSIALASQVEVLFQTFSNVLCNKAFVILEQYGQYYSYASYEYLPTPLISGYILCLYSTTIYHIRKI